MWCVYVCVSGGGTWQFDSDHTTEGIWVTLPQRPFLSRSWWGRRAGHHDTPPPNPWRIIDRPSSVQILLKELEAEDGSSDVECRLLHVPVWFPAFLFCALCSMPFLQTICEYLQHIGKYLPIFMNYSFRGLAMPGIEGYIWNFGFLDYLWWVIVTDGVLPIIHPSMPSLWAPLQGKTNRAGGRNCVSLIVSPNLPPLLV